MLIIAERINASRKQIAQAISIGDRAFIQEEASMMDKDLYPHEVFKELYHLRWTVEENYKTAKCRIEIENFSGKSVESVYQDFHAKVTLQPFCAHSEY